MRKGSLDFDFIIAIMLFITVYTSLFVLIPQFAGKEHQQKDNLLTQSRILAEQLIRTPGYPENWTATGDAASLGFAYYDSSTHETYANILDLTKISAITADDCRSLTSKLLTGTELTNFKITFITNGSADNYTCIRDAPNTSRVIERIAYTYDGENYNETKIVLQVW